MVVVPAVPVDPAASEEANEVLQNIPARGPLSHGELRSNLPTESHLVAPIDRAAEAAFTVDEANDPSDGRESFLLVFRTSIIVTAGHGPTVTVGSDATSSRGCTGFPAYGRLRTASSPMRGAAPPACLGDSLP